jgi:HK97 gp10 family phage protein
MADGMTVDMAGMNTLVSVLGDLDTLTKVRIMKAIIDAANTCADDAHSTVPVDTGELRDSEYVLFQELAAEVGFDSDHAVYPELGTRYQAAQPYLLPAFEATVQQLLSDLTRLF